MDAIQPFLDYFSANPGWALVVVFLIAFGEALLIIGLFVPSTVALLGAGALVGLGKLGFWEVFLCTAIGAILGDQVSYWVGRLYGERLKVMWPLRNYPALVARGEDFMRSHGGKSIALGRFVPGVKAVVPGIAGMLGMGQARFAAVNFSSGLVWALAHVIPGILIGQGLALAGELSGRLVVVLLVLLALLAVAGWLIRLAVGWLWPWVLGLQARIYRWSLTRAEKRWRRFGRVVAPHNPRATSLIVFLLLALFTLFAGLRVMGGVSSSGGALANVDVSVFRMMQALRNSPADELMIMATMIGDTPAILALIAAMAAGLAALRAWRTAAVLVAAAVLAKLFEVAMKDLVARARPLDFETVAQGFSFPSGHATMAMVSLGLLAVVASQNMSRWARAIVYALCAAAALAIAFSRVYLGAHWLSDVGGGLLLGALFTAGFGIYVQAFPLRRAAPFRFAAASIAAWLAAGSIHIAWNYAAQSQAYAPRSPAIVLTFDQWSGGQWSSLPARRVDLAGKEDEPFAAQWVGNSAPIASALAAEGWTLTEPWAWRASAGYLNPAAELKDLLPRPALHEGLQADLTLIKPVPGDDAARLVVRVWKTDYRIGGTAAGGEVHLVSVTRDVLRRGFELYAIPSVNLASAEDIAAIVALLKKAGQVVAAKGGDPVLILARQ
jgi:membrane protein DedA with SNARE-associated domain/membrane-associated phospholipid phosphatase